MARWCSWWGSVRCDCVVCKIDSTFNRGWIGRSGEHLTAAILESLGWSVAMAPIDHIDMIAMRDGHMIRVQVKSTAKPQRGIYRVTMKSSAAKSFEGRVPRQHVDIVACAILDIRRVYCMTSSRLPKSFMINREMLALNDIERTSWYAALRMCGVEYHEETG